ncbi:PilN domain-containing protein [Candidatus Nitrotoga sp. 1052]|uniref:PilN domain-containing protein n=1 Tax=Candidatus Nitrotoga sp. 1052 TaxID=2886964 RepID=UPI001EF63F10|nr:PilN domain-containing protein [Candidatus Nitrotoga sp. 1052]CAH1077598.1 General secretion pathway protein L [Candidatus Nitrotoga sp. 1052]
MTNKIQAARQPRFTFDRNSPLGHFWRWWSGELIALVPQWLRQSSANAANELLIEVTPQAVILQRWLHGSLTEQGRVDRQSGDNDTQGIAFQVLFSKLHKRDERVALWLADTQCLSKQIELPLAAAKNLRQVLGFEMDRHTPFKAEQVYFDFRVLRVDNQKNRLIVKLVVVPRSEMDNSLDLLERWGAPANAAYVASIAVPDGDAINLMPTERNPTQPSKLRGINPGLLLLTLLLAMTAITIPIWQKRQAVIALLPIVDRAKQQARETDALRREQERLSAEYNFMLDKKQIIPPLVVLLDELSRLLPDDTWVQQFNLKGKELQIQGETGSSSKLIALIESARILHNANFRSPLTKGDMPNSERYHLAAEIKAVPATGIVAPAPEQSAPQPPSPAGEPETGKPDNGASQSEQPISESSKLEAEKFNSPLPLRVPALKPALPTSNTPVKQAIKATPYPEAKP